jgi:hypothetical protein
MNRLVTAVAKSPETDAANGDEVERAIHFQRSRVLLSLRR